MANTKSAIKRIRRISKQTIVNKARKSRFRNALKKMNLLINGKKKNEALKYSAINAAGIENTITRINSFEKISLKFSLLIGIDWLFCIYYEYWFFRLRIYHLFYN